ncbi:low-temperature-induced 65 kDa protein isoform X3 [Ziziphus jujuba]|uniref:Low-temperature-induced 65 kDa protein isoform X3 n=1 Tax=Ziziphus jujuba TaxID=326968 RepID=A0ABM3ICY4_ZIZJJ|nr:low-temperature-induced 65 kDa protein isoform X3 [Ziziphus jujuba]
MDSEIVDPHSHIHEQDPDSVAHAEVDEHDHEKPSVLKRVKAKAKKIKETLKNHGHGHNHDHDHDYDYHHDGHIPDDHDLDEEDDEDEKIEVDPEIHGAPKISGMPHGDPLASKEEAGVKFNDPAKISVPPQEANIGKPNSNFERATVISEEPKAPVNTKESSDPSRTLVSGPGGNLGESKVNLERPKGMQEDPHAPKDVHHQTRTPPNYQTKVSDPTGAGAEEVGVAPILSSFDKMKIHDDSEPNSKLGLTTQAPTGSHDQFSPEPFLSNSGNTPQNPQKMEENLDDIRNRNRNDRAAASANTNTYTSNPTSYTDKILSATNNITDKAISAKNAVASKLGYGNKDNTETHGAAHATNGSGDGTAKPSSATEYGKKIAATVTEKLTPVYGKVAGAGSTVMSKMHGSGTGNEPENKAKGVSVKDYFAEKLKPGDEDRALCDVISGSLHLRQLDPEKKADDQPRPMGKVTQSEEVTRRLGTGEDKADKERQETVAGYVNRPEEHEGGNGKGMVDKITGAMGSLFGLGGGDRSSQTPQGSTASSHVGGEQGYATAAGGETGHYSNSKNEQRLQESGN